MPKDLQDAVENSSQVKQEILNVSQMLQIQGFPSRSSLISQINLKNQHLMPSCPSLGSLFKLIEFEDSPFKIAKQGPDFLQKTLDMFPDLASYSPLIKRTLAVRILQKSKAFYTTLAFKTLANQLKFFGSWEKIEQLLFECNREGLVITVVDHENKIISFDQEVQVTESLLNFGAKLRTAFSKIAETKTMGQERQRIFLKVKEKLDEETSRVQQLKEQMTQNKELITRDLQTEMDNLTKQREKEENERKAAFEAQKIIDEQRRAKNELMDQLNRQRQVRAREVLSELLSRGIKKVGKDKIQELDKREEDLDYDTIMTFYQNVLRREREAFEISKNKKVNDVEIWARALKEEECIAMNDYCVKNGNSEMENIRKAIEEKHAKELQTKKALESAQGAFKSYKQKLLDMRSKIHQDEQVKFAIKQGDAAKDEIMAEAKKQLQIIMVRKMNEEAAAMRRKKDLEKQAMLKAEGRDVVFEGQESNTAEAWGRGSGIAEAKKLAAEFDARNAERNQRKEQREPENNMFSRGVNVNKAEKKEEVQRKPREDN